MEKLKQLAFNFFIVGAGIIVALMMILTIGALSNLLWNYTQELLK